MLERYPILRSLGWLIAVGIMAFGAYYASILAFGGTGRNEFAYFDKLAISFLNGRLDILTTGATLDLVRFEGKWYVPFPPLPALLFIPWIWWFGILQIDAFLFSIILGSVNVMVMFGLLRSLDQHGFVEIPRPIQLGLTVLFALGSVHWYMTLQASVWFLAQLSTFTFMGLAAWAEVRHGRGWLTGLLLGIAMLARPHIALGIPFFMALAWIRANRDDVQNKWKRLITWNISCAIPMFLAFGSLLAYNDARFGDPFEFGYTDAQVNRDLRADLQEYGQFHPVYLQQNLRALLWAMPVLDDDSGLWLPDLQGMSIFLTTPAFIFLFWSFRHRTWLTAGAWTAVLLILIPLMLYYNTGWWQFGYRFSLDFAPPLFVLVAIGLQQVRHRWVFYLLLASSILINAGGTIWFMGKIGRPLFPPIW